MRVCAVVVAGGARTGHPDAVTPIRGVPMVVWSVRALLASGVVDRVLLDLGGGSEAVLACAGLPVQVRERRGASDPFRAHVAQRADATWGDDLITACSAEVVIVHDVARPLAPPELFGAVLGAVLSGHDVVAPVLPLTDTVKQVDAAGLVRGTPDRSGLRVVQTPYAFRVAAGGIPEADPLKRAAAGSPVHTVVGDPLAFAVRTPWDLELAELLAEGRAT